MTFSTFLVMFTDDAIVAGSYVFRKIKKAIGVPARAEGEPEAARNVKKAEAGVPPGFEPATLLSDIRDEAAALYSEARVKLAGLDGTGEAVRGEWQALASTIYADEGWIGDAAHAARDFAAFAVGTGKRTTTRSADALRRYLAAPPSRTRPASATPRTFWRALKQTKDLFLEDTRSRQLQVQEATGRTGETAFSQLAEVEQSVNRYLKVAASSVAVAAVGVLFLPPLKLASGALILYAAFPVFKQAYTEIVEQRRISIRLLDSISFIGLLAGGFFLICSGTATIFHASTRLMLKTEDRSRRALANLFGQQPRTVQVLVDGKEIEIAFEKLTVGDTLVVHAGQMIPIDGVIGKGAAAIDQHILTGEAQPAEKGPGDHVFAATMLLAGRIEVQVQKTGAETAAARIRELLASTTDFRTAIQARWRDVADKTVVPTLGLAGIALVVLSPLSALAVINSNYVAVMKVASPLGMLNFLQRASQAGILIKDGRALEATCKVDTVVLDKTGTLTENQPHVGEIYAFADTTPEEVLLHAAAIEANQKHPIALAILAAANGRHLTLPPLEDARYEVGYGIRARIDGRVVRVGSKRYMAFEKIPLPGEFDSRQEAIHARGASLVYVAFEDKVVGCIELRPTLRSEAKRIIRELKELGLTPYIISGDQPAPTEALAKELGIDNYFAEVLPPDKATMVQKLQNQGRRVCFVGDGINDAIALKAADVSVSLRGASSLATDTAQIILMDESLKQLTQLFVVARDYNVNLKTLITTTFVPGFISLAGVFLLGFGNLAALGIFNLSMIAGLINAVRPALQTLDEPNPDFSPAGGADSQSAASRLFGTHGSTDAGEKSGLRS